MEVALSHARLRPWRLDDSDALARHANNRNVSRNLRDIFPFPYTEADAQAFLARVVPMSPATNLAIEVDGEAAGGIGLRVQSDVYRRTAEIGYWLSEAHWGRGIMTEAVVAMTAHAFEQFDLLRIEADVFARNPASMRVLEKAGFEREAWLRQRVTKGGETMDAAMYALLRPAS
ncbi:MAG: N-acetyltransferase [Dehalococcoidia bacterium]|nr:MAG: N-acetyltransferase [Dehalococcoidia bacterium]